MPILLSLDMIWTEGAVSLGTDYSDRNRTLNALVRPVPYD